MYSDTLSRHLTVPTSPELRSEGRADTGRTAWAAHIRICRLQCAGRTCGALITTPVLTARQRAADGLGRVATRTVPVGPPGPAALAALVAAKRARRCPRPTATTARSLLVTAGLRQVVATALILGLATGGTHTPAAASLLVIHAAALALHIIVRGTPQAWKVPPGDGTYVADCQGTITITACVPCTPQPQCASVVCAHHNHSVV